MNRKILLTLVVLAAMGASARFFAPPEIPPTPDCLGDINGDKFVNFLDLALMARAWGSGARDRNWNPNADIYPDGEINLFDLAVLGQNYHKRC